MPKYDFYEINSQLSLPYLSSKREVLEVIFKILSKKYGLKKRSNQLLIDLGSGNGIVIIHASLIYGIKSKGIEVNENLIREAKIAVEKLKPRVQRLIEIERGDLFQENLNKFDFIYIFSLPTMQKFLLHVFKTIKKSAVIISYGYPMQNMDNIIKLSYEIKIQEEPVFFYKKKME